MNWNQIEGNWEQFKGKAQTQWGKLTDDDLDVIKGKRKELAGKLLSKPAPKKQRRGPRDHANEFAPDPHGEDAFFICKDESALGVADGVSQWVDVDVDAGECAGAEPVVVGDDGGFEVAGFAKPALALAGESLDEDFDDQLDADDTGEEGEVVELCHV